MSGSALRVAVVGVGHLGRHHARVLADVADVDLVAVVDTDPERAAAAAAASGATAETDLGRLVDRLDAAIVAVPTDAHLEVARPLLERGIGVLVEKPMARTVSEADQMLAAAQGSGAVFAVGHTERYNPAVAAIWPLVSTPRFIEVHRLGTFPARSLDIDVVFDLMIHDLDVIVALLRDEVESVEAVGVPVLTDRVDIANARLRFRSGCIANLTASRISRERVRKARFFQPGAYLSIDYDAQKAEAWRLVQVAGGDPAIEGGMLDVQPGEPLQRELTDFIQAVRAGRPAAVSGEDGRRALVLAQRISEHMERGV